MLCIFRTAAIVAGMNVGTVGVITILGLAAMITSSICSGEALDYSVDPRLHENFYEASFRFVIPDTVSQPKAIVVFIPAPMGMAVGW